MRPITPAELGQLVEQHIEELWREPAAEVNASVELLASFGLRLVDVAVIAANHVNKPVPAGVKPLTEKTSNFISGLLFGLWLARELETASLAIEADHFRETAINYGRVLQALVARNGGPIELEQADMLNDTTMVVVETDGDLIRVVLEELPGAG